MSKIVPEVEVKNAENNELPSDRGGNGKGISLFGSFLVCSGQRCCVLSAAQNHLQQSSELHVAVLGVEMYPEIVVSFLWAFLWKQFLAQFCVHLYHLFGISFLTWPAVKQGLPLCSPWNVLWWAGEGECWWRAGFCPEEARSIKTCEKSVAEKLSRNSGSLWSPGAVQEALSE